MAPILGTFAAEQFPSERARWTLIAIYSPYLLVPLLLVAAMLRSAHPFARDGAARAHAKKGR